MNISFFLVTNYYNFKCDKKMCEKIIVKMPEWLSNAKELYKTEGKTEFEGIILNETEKAIQFQLDPDSPIYNLYPNNIVWLPKSQITINKRGEE